MKMEYDPELNELMAGILKQLQKCRIKIDGEFSNLGFDMAYFDVDINLTMKVDTATVSIKETWERMEHS